MGGEEKGGEEREGREGKERIMLWLKELYH